MSNIDWAEGAAAAACVAVGAAVGDAVGAALLEGAVAGGDDPHAVMTRTTDASASFEIFTSAIVQVRRRALQGDARGERGAKVVFTKRRVMNAPPHERDVGEAQR
jgi:hypothetical protein